MAAVKRKVRRSDQVKERLERHAAERVRPSIAELRERRIQRELNAPAGAEVGMTHRQAIALVERALRDSTGGDVVTGWSGRWWG